MNPQRDEIQLRRYREASRKLDERPAAGTRAAILAAAAREVGARPVDAQSVRTVRSGRLRWPWAAAAAVMLSTLAVMMATRTEQEQPVFTAPAEPTAEIGRERATEPQPVTEATPPVAQAAPPAAVSASGPARDAQRSNMASTPAQPLRKEKRELAAAPEPAAVARPKTEPAAEADAVVADARVPEPAAQAPAAPPARPAPPASAPAATAESASGAIGGLRSSEREAKEQRELREERSRRQDAVAGTAKTAQKPAADENEATIEQRPEDWLQKIVRLRASGRHHEADAELKRFRERYPQWPVPPAALAPAATR
jgi:hypothetical protein